MINRIFFRNNTGQPILVVSVTLKHVGFYILHISTREKMGSIKQISLARFATRYCER